LELQVPLPEYLQLKESTFLLLLINQQQDKAVIKEKELAQ
jgi:hypothetical protein